MWCVKTKKQTDIGWEMEKKNFIVLVLLIGRSKG